MSKVSGGLRRALKNRSRRSQRTEVVFFFVWMAIGLSEAGQPFRLAHLGWLAFPYLWVAGNIFRFWRCQQLLPVSSLEDRAILEYGTEFDRLTEEQQNDLLRRYRVGTYYLNYFPDERQATQEQKAHVRAYGVLTILLPLLAIVYWAGWRWIPEGRFRAGWTDGPVVLAWLVLLVLALPQMIRMWTEPDEIWEPGIAVEKRA